MGFFDPSYFDLKKILPKRLIREAWKSTFTDAAKEMEYLVSTSMAENLSQRPGLLRYFFRTVHAGLPLPTIEQLSITIAFEYFRMNYNIPTCDLIPYYADLIRKAWLKKLQLIGLQHHQTNDLTTAEAFVSTAEGTKLNGLLSDTTELSRAYFSSYSIPEGMDCIRIFYPNLLGTNHLDRSFDIQTDLSFGMERGFYRHGYEYAVIKNDEFDWLFFAYLGSESKEMAKYSIRKPDDDSYATVTDSNVIWAD